MAANSFTSSSDPPAHGPRSHARSGFPWAFALALAMVAAVEIFLHTRSRMSLIAYASDEGQYHAVRDTVDAIGPAEVALVGSSQMREGVSMPVLTAELEKRLGRKVVVANYAVRGARLDGMAAIVRFLQRQPKPPALIVVGLSQRDLRADDIDWPRVALFWDWADWWKNLHRHGFEAVDVLPVMVRNAAGRVLDTLRYREEIALTIQRPLAVFGVETHEDGNPILGQMTDQHAGARGARNLSTTSISMLRRIFERAKDTYLFDLPPKPRRAMLTSLVDLTADLATGRAKGLLVQMPVADFLEQELDKSGQTKTFQKAVGNAIGDRVPYVASDRRPFRPTNEHFVDLQHLNRPGAEAMSAWLAEEIAKRLTAPK